MRPPDESANPPQRQLSLELAHAEAGERAAEVQRLIAEVEIVDRPHLAWWIAILGGMTLTGALALSSAAYAWFAANVTPSLPRGAIVATFVWACWLHVKKGLRAVQLAERAGLHETALGWGWQTCLLGFASLGLLEKRIARRSSGQAGAK
jgi:hypothetical protein